MEAIFELFKKLNPVKKSSTKKNKSTAKGKTRKQNGG